MKRGPFVPSFHIFCKIISKEDSFSGVGWRVLDAKLPYKKNGFYVYSSMGCNPYFFFYYKSA